MSGYNAGLYKPGECPRVRGDYGYGAGGYPGGSSAYRYRPPYNRDYRYRDYRYRDYRDYRDYPSGE